MNNLVMSWQTEDGRLVRRWSKSGDSCETAVTTEIRSAQTQTTEYQNAEVVFELGDAA